MYYRKLESGVYDIVFSADGYENLEIAGFNILENTQTELNVQLEQSDNTDIDTVLEDGYELVSYVNPFKNKIVLEIEFAKETEVQVLIYNVSGRLILKTKNELYSKGANFLKIDTQSLEKGYYICVLKSPTLKLNLNLVKI